MSGVIDCASRNVLAAHVHRTEPNAVDVLRLLKEAILPKRNRMRPWFGIFVAANTDNAWIYKDSSVAAAMLRLGVDWQHSPKACSAANGKIERLFGTFTTRLFKKLPGYSGRPNAKARVEHCGGIPFPLMQGIVDRFIDTEYSLRRHSELGMSPWEAWHENLESVPNLIFDVREVSNAFRYPRTAEVHRGAIVIDGRAYKAPELAGLTGKSVTVWLDPDSIKKRLDITYQGKPLCQAVRDDGDLADELNAQRTARTVSLRKVRKDAKAILATTPPHEVIPIHRPKRPRKAKTSVASQIVPAPPLAVEE